MKKIKLTVLTPDKTLISGVEVDSIILPAQEGEMGILPNHAPYVVQLKEGLLKYKTGADEEFIAVFWGFASVTKNTVTVLTEVGELIKEINEERARQEYQKAKNAINMSGADLDMDSAQASLKKAIIRMKLAEMRKNKRM